MKFLLIPRLEYPGSILLLWVTMRCRCGYGGVPSGGLFDRSGNYLYWHLWDGEELFISKGGKLWMLNYEKFNGQIKNERWVRPPNGLLGLEHRQEHPFPISFVRTPNGLWPLRNAAPFRHPKTSYMSTLLIPSFLRSKIFYLRSECTTPFFGKVKINTLFQRHPL